MQKNSLKKRKKNARKQDAKLHDEQITTMQKKHKMNEKVKQKNDNVKKKKWSQIPTIGLLIQLKSCSS